MLYPQMENIHELLSPQGAGGSFLLGKIHFKSTLGSGKWQ
jgi:hypothetical protein